MKRETGNKVDIISCQFQEFIAQFPGMYRMEWYIWKKSCMYRGKEMKRKSGLCSCECNLCSWVKKHENCRILIWYIPVIYSTTKCSQFWLGSILKYLDPQDMHVWMNIFVPQRNFRLVYLCAHDGVKITFPSLLQYINDSNGRSTQILLRKFLLLLVTFYFQSHNNFIIHKQRSKQTDLRLFLC